MILLAHYTSGKDLGNSAKSDAFSSFWLNFWKGKTNIIVLRPIEWRNNEVLFIKEMCSTFGPSHMLPY
jgi:hypothetical protein